MSVSDWVKEKIVGMLAPKYIGSLIRFIMAFISGYLIKLALPQAVIDNFLVALEPVLTGGITAGAALLWSLIQKNQSIGKNKAIDITLSKTGPEAVLAIKKG